MVTLLVENIAGRGVRFATQSFIFIARDGTVEGGISMLAENLADDAAVLTMNSGADDGTLANTVDVTAGVAAGIDGTAPDSLGCIVLASEPALVDGVFRGYVEGYDVNALVEKSSGVAAMDAREGLFMNTATVPHLDNLGQGIGAPCVGRVVRRVPVGAGPIMSRIHFCGLPGGFGVGSGLS